MNIKSKVINGKRFIYGRGTPAEVERLNVEKNFDDVLDRLYAIKRSVYYLFNVKDAMKVKRKMHGKRKAVRE